MATGSHEQQSAAEQPDRRTSATAEVPHIGSGPRSPLGARWELCWLQRSNHSHKILSEGRRCLLDLWRWQCNLHEGELILQPLVWRHQVLLAHLHTLITVRKLGRHLYDARGALLHRLERLLPTR